MDVKQERCGVAESGNLFHLGQNQRETRGTKCEVFHTGQVASLRRGRITTSVIETREANFHLCIDPKSGWIPYFTSVGPSRGRRCVGTVGGGSWFKELCRFGLTTGLPLPVIHLPLAL
jgi:hypothetical protein